MIQEEKWRKGLCEDPEPAQVSKDDNFSQVVHRDIDGIMRDNRDA